MDPLRRLPLPLLAAALAVGLVLGGLWIGFEPVGADPDLMYRPIKAELARALRAGRLPYWSEHFGLGVPLVAESHAGAFYPPNWLAYRALGVAAAYRLMMWLHSIALAVATYAYARRLGLTDWGAALAGVSFALCGFQAIHSGHEPFYHAMPYLPLCLLLADRFAAGGRWGWLAGLALAWGAQWTLGHFQTQFWTGVLVLGLGLWRAAADRRPRPLGLVAALAWGAAVAAPQLALTRELTAVAGFERPFVYLSNYSFPPAHWAQPALPYAFMDLAGGPQSAYWHSHETTGAEACFYVGTVPLVLAAIGLVVRDRALAPWKWVVAASLVAATMPRWWQDGFWLLTRLPGFGHFRCPARYTALASLGLALLAGRGLDRAIAARRFRLGLSLALAFGAAAFAWSAWWWSHDPVLRKFLGEWPWPAIRFGTAAAAWAVAVAAIVAWRRGSIGAWGPLAATLVELAALYYHSTVSWGWSVPFPEGSPIVRRLARESGVGLIAGRLESLPARAGLTAAYPYLGITPPPPNYLLETTRFPDRVAEPPLRRWMRRFGVTHGVWWSADSSPAAEVVAEGEDPALDRLFHGGSGEITRRVWKLVRYPDAAPPAWVALTAGEVADWQWLYDRLASRDPALPEAFYIREDAPPPARSPRARAARVRSWDGRTAVVEHDGACDLIVRRTPYPGWTARIDDGPEQPVGKANALQAVRLDGIGVSRVVLRYRPTALRPASRLALAALVAAVLVLGLSASRRRPNPSVAIRG